MNENALQVKGIDGEMVDLGLYTINLKGCSEFQVQLLLEVKQVTIEVDAGSAVSIIHETENNNLFENLPLQPTTHKLRTYYAKGNKPEVLGHDWLEKLKLDWSSSFKVTQENAAEEITSRTVTSSAFLRTTVKGLSTYQVHCGNQVGVVYVDDLKSTACESSGPVVDMGAQLEELPPTNESEFSRPMTSGYTIVYESPISASTPHNDVESANTERVEDCSVPKGETGSTVKPNPAEFTTPKFARVGLANKVSSGDPRSETFL
ncbi:hypothetical protein ACROYT_G010964 [Oculina patagonica]